MIIVLCLILAFLYWRRAHPYRVTRAQMKSALERILEKKMTGDELAPLVDRRITRDRYLESVRERLQAIPRRNRPWPDGALYDASGLRAVGLLLDELRTKRHSVGDSGVPVNAGAPPPPGRT